jgi:hypothetical protein
MRAERNALRHPLLSTPAINNLLPTIALRSHPAHIVIRPTPIFLDNNSSFFLTAEAGDNAELANCRTAYLLPRKV